MKILTWNINGVRAVQREKKTLKDILDSLSADVICLQETKVTRDMLDEVTAVVDGYESYFSFSRKKTGYSGTANYCNTRTLPFKAEEGLTGKLTTPHNTNVCNYGNTNCFTQEELTALDDEGRCVITQHTIWLPTDELKEVAIINVYVPRAGDREDRHRYKLLFLTLLQIRAEALLKNGIHVIILGDINTTHRPLDNCDAQDDAEFQRKSSRIWLNRLLQPDERDKDILLTDANFSDIPAPNVSGGCFSDVYRRLHPSRENAFTNWCTLTGARQTNYGRRLDYILLDVGLAKFVTHCEIMSDFEGSDHCPVVVTLNCSPVSSQSSPSLCSKFMPEFRGQQQKLSSFFTKSTKPLQTPHRDHVEWSWGQSQSKSCIEKELFMSQSQGKNTHTLKTEKSHCANGLKRSLTLAEQTGSRKKTKLKKGESSSSSLTSKQVTLTSFFNKNNKGSNGKQELDQIVAVGDRPCESVMIINSNSETEKKIGCFSISDNTLDQISLSQDCVTGSEMNSSSIDSNSLCSRTEEKNDLSSTTTAVSKEGSQQTSLKDPSPKLPRSSATAWKGLLGGLPPPPLCPGHKEPSVLRTVKKAGPNKNKMFYVCARPDGAVGNPVSRCNFFKWVNNSKK